MPGMDMSGMKNMPANADKENATEADGETSAHS
jgi:hypothetical protein